MPFVSLWLPIAVSAVAIFVLSSIFHMVLKHHRADYRGLPNEAEVAEVMRKAKPGPGLYAIPYCPDPSSMNDPAVIRRYTEGPVGLFAVRRSGPPTLGKALGQWFAFCLFVSFVASYLARHSLSSSADGLTVMRITGTAAFLGYAAPHLQASIWSAVPWANAYRGVIDSALYAIATGLVFRLLWHAA